MANKKANFISYITQSVLDSKQSSFQSYIDNQTEEDGYDLNHIDETASQFFDMELLPHLLPGEKLIGDVDGVLKYVPYSEGKQGMSGNLCITNFKMSFVTADRSSYDMKGKRQRNKLLAEDDIPLTCIDAIYQETKNGKRKKLIPGVTVSSKTELLEIHCKDFRIHKFGFKLVKSPSKSCISTLVQHAFPTRDNCLFAYDYVRNKPSNVPGETSDVPQFDCISDWEEEIRRCKSENGWRVCDVNISYELSQSLPQYFVVPNALMNADLQRAAPHFTHRRVPTWCHTHINGNSLVRMSAEEESSDQPQQPRSRTPRVLDAVKVAGNQRNSPKVIDIAECCPSCREVQESFIKLKKLCMSDTEREFAVQDMTWLSSLDDTKWLQLVSRCLTASKDVAEYIVDKKRTVVIKEESGCDLSCLVTSVAQIYLDPYFRTMVGFQALIQKEWVRMGHPFQKYLAVVTNKGDAEMEQVPVFLLFLDCVWQLLQQFPSCFEFTETYLTTIWDTSHIGIFSTFLFNNDHQKMTFLRGEKKNIRQYHLPVAWKWDLQFQTEDLSLFKNPLYVIMHDGELSESLNEIRELAVIGKRSQTSRHNSVSKQSKPVSLHHSISPEQNGIDEHDVMTPQCAAPVLKLWSQCYLRWQMPAQIFSGGTPSEYLQQCHMVEEIIQLQHKAKQLQIQSSRGALRPRSDLIFGHTTNSPNLTELLNSTALTSSFPFSPGASSKDIHRFAIISISSFVRNSALDLEKYADADD